MSSKIHTFQLPVDFDLINALSVIDRFGGEWTAIEKREGVRTLRELRSVATVQSTGASTRIEGSTMTDQEVDVLISDMSVAKLEERDQQEVLGYYNVLDMIIEAYQDISVSENSIQHLHKLLLKHCEKDSWHRGGYKQHSNSVEATHPDGSKTTIFHTTPPGVETEMAMRSLFEWYQNDHSTPALIKVATFVYDFVSIHPFQDGNGKLSRLLGTLLLLKNGYPWIQYVSFEHEIENRKQEYYRVLMECQQQRPGENIYPWIMFFTDCLGNIQQKLMQKLTTQERTNQLSQREKAIYAFIDNHPGTQSSEIAEKLDYPLPTVKRILADMVKARFLVQHGIGKATNYTTENHLMIKRDIMMEFTCKESQQERVLLHRHHFIDLKKIILRPHFQWSDPNEWYQKLRDEDMRLTITAYAQNEKIYQYPLTVDTYVSPMSYQPVLTIHHPVHIPGNLAEGIPNENEYPIKVKIEITSKKEQWEFDVVLLYDAALE